MADRPHNICLAVLGLLLIAAAPATGRTWTVERDGSGDFTVIQDAVDAASSGDVIAIGAGRFDEYQEVQGGAHWFDVHVLVPDGMSLTFEGAGSDATIIGPEDPAVHTNGTYGIGGVYDIGLTVSGVSFENCNQFSIGYTTGALDVADCRFFFGGEATSNTRGIHGSFNPGSIVRCEFSGLYEGVALLSTPGAIDISDCDFEACTTGVYAWSPGQGDVSVLDCEFHCDVIGISFVDGTSGSIEYCNLRDCVLSLDHSNTVSIANCEVERTDGGNALSLRNQGPATIIDSIFRSDGIVVYLASYGLGTFVNNHFIRTGSDYWIYCPYHPSFQQDIDLSGNWWGTTDVDEIAAGIWDCADDDHAYHCVIFEPIADGPVSVESRNWSEVKGLFRGDDD